MPDRTIVDRLRLPPEPTSAARARGFVAQHLAAINRRDLTDTAQLAVSELVTNAVLHANTAIELTVTATANGVRIEVSDEHPGLPTARHYGDQATTGRGLSLVAALAMDFGIEATAPAGKRIWFTLDVERRFAGAFETLEWDLDDLLADEPSPTDSSIVLHNLPTLLWQAAQQHHDAVLRELLLYRAAVETQGEENEDLAAAQEAQALLAFAVDAALARAASDESHAPALPEGHPSPVGSPLRTVDVELPTTADADHLFAAL